MSEVKQKPGSTVESASFVLADFTPYRIVALGHAVSNRLSQAYQNENLTIPEWRVLAVISQADGMAARDVVAKTPMDKMAVSRGVASLEEKGLVLRKASENDRRVSMLLLSEKGHDLFDRITAMATAYEANLLSVLDPDEVRLFDGVMRKLETHALLQSECAGDNTDENVAS